MSNIILTSEFLRNKNVYFGSRPFVNSLCIQISNSGPRKYLAITDKKYCTDSRINWNELAITKCLEAESNGLQYHFNVADF